MNKPKIYAYALTSAVGILSILQAVVPVLPKEWADFVQALLALLAVYHIGQSHTPAALGAAGYVKE